MMRSLFSGVSGLRAHQTRMDVIGNNVANVNTVAFKSGRVTFQEILNQTLRGASAPDTTTGGGGTNPMTVGLGLNVGAVDTMMTAGSLQRTDNPTDLSIEGDGFFIAKAGTQGAYMFTRAGNFGIDKSGNLVTGDGLNIYGWQQLKAGSTSVFDTESPLETINLYNDAHRNKRIIPASTTKSIEMAGNLDASYTSAPAQVFSVPMTVYDSQGKSYKVQLDFTKTGVNAWTVGAPAASGVTVNGGATVAVTFDNQGKITAPAAAITLAVPATGGGANISASVDLSKLSQFTSDCSVKPTKIDGYTMGNLVTFNVGADGIITGIYDNGQQQALGQIALATFENPAGMQKVGSNNYIPTTNSGDFTKGVRPGVDGAGTLNPGTLEMSNVDLSKEFTDMIVTERGFQANSRIITTSDEMLQELVNLKR